jgi:hypothetical protein
MIPKKRKKEKKLHPTLEEFPLSRLGTNYPRPLSCQMRASPLKRNEMRGLNQLVTLLHFPPI